MTYRKNTSMIAIISSLFILFLAIPLVLFAFTEKREHGQSFGYQENSQTMTLLHRNGISSSPQARGGSVISVDSNALVPIMGVDGVVRETVFTPQNQQVSLYVVQDGDTLGHIAQLFGVSVNTIRWANDLGARGTIRPGQVLSILPINSVRHEVEKGDTLESIVKKYQGEIEDTAIFNGLDINAQLEEGQIILIPDGIMAEAKPTPAPSPARASTQTTSRASTPAPARTASTQRTESYFIRAWGGVVSQGYHGPWRAVDYAMPIGNPIGASAAGTVVAARSPHAWNGGYGGLIILQHDNGAQTYYAHLDQLSVSVGQHVKQGELIGLSGNTGRSTGPHLHFEIRNWGDIPMNW